jgi:uncharacterized Ntn-hydrolase superfamily protein
MTQQDFCNTYSIIARDPVTGQLGVAVQTHQVGVGRLVPWTLPGVGVIATQSMVNISFGTIGLQMLRNGIPAPRVVDALIASDEGRDRRQLAVIDVNGQVSAYTGSGCIREAGHYIGSNYSVQANMMTRSTVIDAMRHSFERAKGDLAARMMAALSAAQSHDGDIRGMQSAALKVVSGRAGTPEWETIYDLRVDEHDQPLAELGRLMQIRSAQLVDQEGHELLDKGNMMAALAKWKEARAAAPDQEELAFWQAYALADARPDDNTISLAARIMAQALQDGDRYEHWIELLRRLDECAFSRNAGIGERLVKALQENP